MGKRNPLAAVRRSVERAAAHLADAAALLEREGYIQEGRQMNSAAYEAATALSIAEGREPSRCAAIQPGDSHER